MGWDMEEVPFADDVEGSQEELLFPIIHPFFPERQLVGEAVSKLEKGSRVDWPAWYKNGITSRSKGSCIPVQGLLELK